MIGCVVVLFCYLYGLFDMIVRWFIVEVGFYNVMMIVCGCVIVCIDLFLLFWLVVLGGCGIV